MGHVSVLAQLYVLVPWVLWFLHSRQPSMCVPLPDRLFLCCFCGLPLPIRAVVSRVSVLSLVLVLPVALPLALSWTLSLTLSVALSFMALALANLALVALALVALALASLALASFALSDLALADLALADLDLSDLALAALVGGPGLGWLNFGGSGSDCPVLVFKLNSGLL